MVGRRAALAAVVALVVACSAAGCAGNGSDDPENKSKKRDSDSENASYTVEMGDAYLANDYDGDKLLVVDLEMTGNTREGVYLSEPQWDATATLDGERLADGYLMSDNPNYIDVDGVVDKGDTEASQLVFELPSNTPEGTVELSLDVATADLSDTVNILEEEIELGDLELRVSETDYELAVTSGTLTVDADGAPALLMNLTFTNNSSRNCSYSEAIEAQFFQNGVELSPAYTGYDNPDADNDLQNNAYAEVQPGASIELQIAIALDDAESPVECSFYDWQSPDMATVLEGVMDLSGSMDEEDVERVPERDAEGGTGAGSGEDSVRI